VLILTFKASRLNTISSNKIHPTNTSKLSLYHFLALFAISFVVGFRNEVGVDWLGYKDIFYDISANIATYEVEYGYFLINKYVAVLGGSSSIMFFIIALISWYFIFLSVPNRLLPLTIFFLFADEMFFWSMNGVRQFVAICIFLYSIRFIITRSLLNYFIFISIAILFHNSAIILLPLYFVPFQKLYNQRFWFIAIIISTFFSNVPLIISGLQNILMLIVPQVNLLSGYIGFIDRGQYVAEEISIGLGFLFRFISSIFIIYFSIEVVKRYPKTKIYFVLFFISSVIFNLSYMVKPIGRVNIYFTVIHSVVLALITYQLWASRKHQIVSIIVVLLYFILFLSTIYNSSNLCNPYNFSF